MGNRDPYIAIMKAAALGVGLRLTADECAALSMDDAIATRAANGLDFDQWENGEPRDWAKIDPRGQKNPANRATGPA